MMQQRPPISSNSPHQKLSRFYLAIGWVVLLEVMSLANGCSYIQPTTSAPYYIKIDSIPFTDSLPTTVGRNNGKNAHAITDAWVFANGTFVGAYELPAIIPIPVSGPNVTINIEPGVFSDGIKDYRISYPFYKSFNQIVNLSEGVVVPISFRTTYKADNGNLKIPFPHFYDFESRIDSSQWTASNNNTGTFDRTNLPEEVFPDGGAFSAKMAGKVGSNIVEFQTASQLTLPQNGSPIYLELNYKSTKDVLVGMAYSSARTGASGFIYDLNLLPTNGRWRKIYVSLVDEALTAPQMSNFRLSFRLSNAKSADDYVLLDNLRLLQMNR